MKYETPKLAALTPAMNAIQSRTLEAPKVALSGLDGLIKFNEHIGTYADWE